MALRWGAAGMLEASKQFLRVKGFLRLPALRSDLEAHVNGAVTPKCGDAGIAAGPSGAATEVPRNSDIL